jgi:Cys-tRNA(Pro)/Cys-tRNA(Cys) deacylase
MSETVSTRGIKALREAGAEFEIVEYIYKQKGAARAALAVGWSEDRVIKTLVVDCGDKDFRFALVPAQAELSLKKLARKLGRASVSLASVRDAERLTGYLEGGISPFGSYAALPVLMEEQTLNFDRVLINAGKRGVLVALDPWRILELLNAEADDLIAS